MNKEKWLETEEKIGKIIKKIFLKLVHIALTLLAIGSCFIGCMEFFEWKNYFGLGDEIFFVFSLFFSLMVGAFSAEGFSKFYHDTFDKDKKE